MAKDLAREEGSEKEEEEEAASARERATSARMGRGRDVWGARAVAASASSRKRPTRGQVDQGAKREGSDRLEGKMCRQAERGEKPNDKDSLRDRQGERAGRECGLRKVRPPAQSSATGIITHFFIH